MADIDPRTNPYRADRAAAYLQGRVTATEFVSPVAKAVVAGSAPLRRRPQTDAPLDTELQFGERVEVYEDKDGWSWLQSMTDGYVGYTPSAALGDRPPAPTHALAALRSEASAARVSASAARSFGAGTFPLWWPAGEHVGEPCGSQGHPASAAAPLPLYSGATSASLQNAC